MSWEVQALLKATRHSSQSQWYLMVSNQRLVFHYSIVCKHSDNYVVTCLKFSHSSTAEEVEIKVKYWYTNIFRTTLFGS